MINKKSTWHKIAENTLDIEWQSNEMSIKEVDGKKITLIRLRGKLFACAYKCPHAGGILADGYIDVLNNVVCPLHRYKFSLQNGRNTSGEGYFVKVYTVEERTDGIFVGIEEREWFNGIK